MVGLGASEGYGAEGRELRLRYTLKEMRAKRLCSTMRVVSQFKQTWLYW